MNLAGRMNNDVPEGLEALAVVLLCDGTEPVDAPLVDEVLQASLFAIVPPAIVPLRRNNGFNRMENVVCWDKPQRLCNSGKRAVVPARPEQGSNSSRACFSQNPFFCLLLLHFSWAVSGTQGPRD